MKKLKLEILFLGIIFMVGCCFKNEKEGGIQDEIQRNEDEKMWKEISTEVSEIATVSGIVEVYEYDIEELKFTFYISEEDTFAIPYIRISGCPDEYLEWEINHTLWKEACWIFECGDVGNNIYGLFRDEEDVGIVIDEVYKCGRYLSVVYKDLFYIDNIGGYITYAIVVDMLSGKRILLSDMIENSEAFEALITQAEARQYNGRVNEEVIKKKVEQIMIYGEMTEAETVIYNATSQGKYPENVNVDSISWLFTATSFYMSENEFVIMPGAKYYSPIPFSWDEIEGIVKNPYDLNQE